MYTSLNQVIAAQAPNADGMAYLIAHPQDFVELVKKSFDLAKAYIETPQRVEFRQMLTKAYATRFLSAYPLITQLINFLLDDRYQFNKMPLPNVRGVKINSTAEGIPVVDEISKDLLFHNDLHYYEGNTFVKRVQVDYRSYSQSNLPIMQFDKPQGWGMTIAELKTVMANEKSLLMWEYMNTAVFYARKQVYVQQHLPKIITTLLEHMKEAILLDPEFQAGASSSSSNTTINKLISHQQYEILAKIFEDLSPLLAEKLLLKKFDNTQDVFQKLIANMPASKPALKQAIACLQKVQWENPNIFLAFAKSPRNGDLLQQLKNTHDKDLLDAFCAINPAEIKKFFIASAANVEMPEQNLSPKHLQQQPTASAPPPTPSMMAQAGAPPPLYPSLTSLPFFSRYRTPATSRHSQVSANDQPKYHPPIVGGEVDPLAEYQVNVYTNYGNH